MKVLLLEDEYLLSRSIATYLLAKNYFVDAFDNGEDAYNAIQNEEYDFYILDINTPVFGGLELLGMLQGHNEDAPKIIISAYHDIDYISKAFDLGCSDYLKKPFNLKELQIRIERLMPKEQSTEQNTLLLLSEHYAFDKTTQMLMYDGELVKLSKREYALVVHFVNNLGKLLSDENLRSAIWEDEPVELSTVRSLVNRLRAKLQEDLIENVRGFGYIMNKRNINAT